MNTNDPQKALEAYRLEMDNEIYHFAYYRCSPPGFESLQLRALLLLSSVREGLDLAKAEELLWELEVDRMEIVNQ